MASTSSGPIHVIIDDDDEFDWEAAAIEIDNVGCGTPDANINEFCNSNVDNDNASYFRPPRNDVGYNYSESIKKENQKKINKGKQSTLDNYVGIGSSSGGGMFRGRSVGDGGGFSRNGIGGNAMYDNDIDRNCDDYEGDSFEESVSVKLDHEAAKTWIYPVNAEMRDYQYVITQKALFTNALVVLPTGLGKTLIAAVVMYNYFRWFPEGKIVFAAPSRPLVMQQIEACHKIVGIPQEFTIDLTGQTNATKRADLWKEKRVFFVTPQVLERDISSGSCLAKQLVCLVIDEAHRAIGNYSYCVAVRQLMAVPVQLRILALSATPGSKQQTIQYVIDNLQVSTLEYRDESDHDVAPYVHERTIEVIQVPMGKDAVEISDLLLDVISPFVSRLGKEGVIQNRDAQKLSPYQLLNSRENFRQVKAPIIAENKRTDIEGVFGALLTLYHVRKLLSSHGIKPAFEMLEEKLQGSFARFVSRNEFLIRAKLLMQQYVTHGAPSPKLSKMLDILIDHFRNNDSQRSRVIIFSNFRGSVRDIMNTLAKVGDPVRATEFIGQSSGKTLKGQSQKIQQAVLEKFRSGNFNVIVATSIGEEGLDIMEVDLVICFDANVSPLRMIQRMGRTGRKHEGRVVVLACEGPELKGYLEKKSRNKTIKKHMQSGLNSFNFHSSPRMIPHVIKPEVQLVELSIKQFIHRGKKVKGHQLTHSPAPITNLTNAETEQIAKYFSSMDENVWMPSLIAFPLFQSYPSQVHNVLHSSRTGMFIDAMQHLQESSLVRGKAFVCEDESSSDPCCVGEDVPWENMKGSQTFSELPQKKTPEDNTSYMDTEPKLELHGKCAKSHGILFGSDFTSIEKEGRVQRLSENKLISHSRCNEISEIRYASTSSKSYPEEKLLTSGLHNNDVHLEAASPFESIPLVSSPNRKSDEVDRTDGSPLAVTKKTHPLDDEPNDDWCDAEISPRLTSFIKSGYVPESPINDFDIPRSPDYVSTPKSHKKLKRKLSLRGDNRKSRTCPPENDISADIVDRIERTVAPNNNLPQRCKFATSLDDDRAPLAQLSNFGYSNDCQLNSGEHTNRYVPESPINDFDISRSQDYASPPKSHSNVMKKLSLRGDNRKSHTCPSEKDISADIVDQIERTVDANNNIPQRCKSATSLDEDKAPSAQLSNFSCSNDWKLNSGEHSDRYVPESPINDSDISGSQDEPPKSHSKAMKKLSLRGGNRKSHTWSSEKDISADIVDQIERTVDAKDNLPQRCKSATSPDEGKSPLAQLSNFSCSNDWKLNSGEHSNSVEKPRKFRRLRKYGDHHKKFSLEKREESETFRKFPGCDKQSRGAKKRAKEGFVFIDEEAEVSQHVLMSEDEEDVPDSDSCDDSFIDDRINPTWASTQAEVGGVDMMAVYRRSLLTQSPMVEEQPALAHVSPDSATPWSRSNEGSSFSRTEMHSIKTLNVGPGSNARMPGSLQMNSDKSSLYAILNSDLSSVNRNDACLETRTRKRSFCQEGSLPVHNLEKEFLYASQSAERNPVPERRLEKPEDCDMFDDDDQFFANLDLDAVEAQAAQLLRSKAVQKNVAASDVPHPNFDIADLPTFDLGI